jgi:hypothetical protein
MGRHADTSHTARALCYHKCWHNAMEEGAGL